MKDYDHVRANFKGAKLLVIEDSDDHWMFIKSALQYSLPEVTAVRVTTSEQALGLLNDWCIQEWEMPKLIIQDLYLPSREMGWQLLEHIKSLPAPASHIPVVIMSSSEYKSDITESYQRGSSSYLIKPRRFTEWIAYFKELRAYWWETVTLPPMHFSI